MEVTLVSPDQFSVETKETLLKEIQTPEPFEGAAVVKTIAVRPAEATARTAFLSVLAPRAASASPTLTVIPVRQPNLVGAEIATGAFRDVALFALEEPEIDAAGVQARGAPRSSASPGDGCSAPCCTAGSA